MLEVRPETDLRNQELIVAERGAGLHGGDDVRGSAVPWGAARRSGRIAVILTISRGTGAVQ
jgi:hypothetical protein